MEHKLPHCPSKFELELEKGVTATYGCGQYAGHLGVHRFFIEWTHDQAVNDQEQQGVTDDA